MLLDKYNRGHDYLRISIIDNCNFRCLYCMPNEKIEFLKKKFLLTPDEIYKIAKIFCDLGVTKIRLTGGEPLLRNDFGEIISKLSTLPIQLGLTTNGLLLDKYLDEIIAAGIKSLNISIDSLNKDNFKQITQRDHFDRVWENIIKSIDRKLHVKLNIVVMKGVNDTEINDLVNLTKELPIHVRFIEFMPFSKNNWDKDTVISNQVILEDLRNDFPLFKLTDKKNDTDKKFGITGHKGSISFISTLTDSFCSNCNRLRLTADGKMKNCLFGKDEIDIINALRKGEKIEKIIELVVLKKHKKLGGQFENYSNLNPSDLENRSMIKIGG